MHFYCFAYDDVHMRKTGNHFGSIYASVTILKIYLLINQNYEENNEMKKKCESLEMHIFLYEIVFYFCIFRVVNAGAYCTTCIISSILFLLISGLGSLINM